MVSPPLRNVSRETADALFRFWLTLPHRIILCTQYFATGYYIGVRREELVSIALVSCTRCHKKFKSYVALKGHWHDAHSNVRWPDEFETKLTEEKGLEGYKISRNVGKISYRKWILLTLVILILVGIAASTFRQGAQTVSTTTSSSTTGQTFLTSISSPSNGFSILSTAFYCVNGTNGLKSATLLAELQSNKNESFHYLSGTITFANYTLANGTVVTVNHQWIDKNQTFDKTHTFYLEADSKISNSGTKIVQAEFIITAHVQEVPQPITKLVIWSIDC